MTTQFQKAYDNITRLIAQNKNEMELDHAKNTLHWLEIIHPKADDVLKLAALAHDLERSVGNSIKAEDYSSYITYKSAHAARSGQLAKEILNRIGFNNADCQKISDLISAAEFPSDEPDVQRICDADSISFFDTNVEVYLSKKGLEATRSKADFMFSRATTTSQQHIKNILSAKELTFLLSD